MNSPDASEIPFLDRLGRHLHDAAIKRSAAPRRHRSPLPAMSLAGVLAVVAVILVILWPRAESAQAFTITQTNGTVRVEVSNIVTNPDAATAQLRDAGLDATLQAVPVPAELVGRVVSLSLQDDAEVEMTRNSKGITTFEVLKTGLIIVEYGRRAADGETYVATQSSPYCAVWRDQRVGDIRFEIENSHETIRWQMFNTSDNKLTEIQQPDANAFVQDVIPLSAQEAFIIMSDKENSSQPPGNARPIIPLPQCAPQHSQRGSARRVLSVLFKGL